MTGDTDFDFFLQNGYLKGFPKATPLAAVIAKYGEEHWELKEQDLNGLTYGIIKTGCIEIHIFDEMVNGVSYQPDPSYNKKGFTDAAPWINSIGTLPGIETELQNRGIHYKKYTVRGPAYDYKTAGATIYIEEGEHTFIDTAGGVTFLFDPNKKGEHQVCQVCRYYELEME